MNKAEFWRIFRVEYPSLPFTHLAQSLETGALIGSHVTLEGICAEGTFKTDIPFPIKPEASVIAEKSTLIVPDAENSVEIS